MKPSIRRVALERAKEMNREKKGELNMLYIRQAYYVRKLKGKFSTETLTNLHHTQSLINSWFEEQSKKIQIQSRKNEFASSESTRIYHHELHKQLIRRSSILKLDTEEGFLEGHDKCSSYLLKKVRELLSHPAELDVRAQHSLLNLVSPVFSSEDNVMLEALPSKSEIKNTLLSSNLSAAAGSDGITALVYKECWDFLGDILTEEFTALFNGSTLTVSMRTAMMHFCSKPKKVNSFKASDKRRISILNCDFKLYEGLIARRFRKLGSRTLSPLQYVAGKNRTIHHGIARARYAIQAASQKWNTGLGTKIILPHLIFLCYLGCGEF